MRVAQEVNNMLYAFKQGLQPDEQTTILRTIIIKDGGILYAKKVGYLDGSFNEDGNPNFVKCEPIEFMASGTWTLTGFKETN